MPLNVRQRIVVISEKNLPTNKKKGLLLFGPRNYNTIHKYSSKKNFLHGNNVSDLFQYCSRIVGTSIAQYLDPTLISVTFLGKI